MLNLSRCLSKGHGTTVCIVATMICISAKMGSFLSWGALLGPKIVRHPYKKDLKRDPTLESYPTGTLIVPL